MRRQKQVNFQQQQKIFVLYPIILFDAFPIIDV